MIGLSCMANLLPFTILAMRALKEAYPDRTLVLGGVGSTAVDEMEFLLESNVLPKLKLLRQFGFYPDPEPAEQNAESCGAHSPRVEPQELATRVER